MAIDNNSASRRSVLKTIATGSAVLGGVTSASSSAVAQECKLASAVIKVKELSGVEAEYHLSWGPSGSPRPERDIEEEEYNKYARNQLFGTVKDDTDVWRLDCGLLTDIDVDDTVGDGGATVAVEIEYEDTVWYTEENPFWVYNEYSGESEYYVRSTGSTEPDYDIESNDSDTGFTVDGSVSDGDYDHWERTGRFSSLIIEPNDNIVYVGSSPTSVCVRENYC